MVEIASVLALNVRIFEEIVALRSWRVSDESVPRYQRAGIFLFLCYVITQFTPLK